jgi:MFS transporter, UMF1 family
VFGTDAKTDSRLIKKRMIEHKDAPHIPRPPHTITRRAVTAWVLYDLANTIFSMGVVSLFFSLWVRSEVGAERADFTYGVITAISMGLIFVASPLLGAMTDRARRRMPFLIVSTIVCVILTAMLARGGFYLTAIFFIIANVAYQAGLQFYDALLPEVSTEETRGRIGGIGVGIGYLGSYIPVVFGILLKQENEPLPLSLLFLLIALSFLLFSLPCFFFVKERGNPRPQKINLRMIAESTRETIRTLRSGREFPGLGRFLIGRIFYTDAINTVISIMALYTVNVALGSGLNESDAQGQANFIYMPAITFAIIGGFFWGWLADRLGAKRTLDLVLMMWMAIFTGAAAVGILGLPLWTLYVVASGAGFAMGGVWSADRPLMLQLTPPDRIGEFYGLYGMVGRFSAITGPIVWAATTYLMIQVAGLAPRTGQGISVLVLLAVMLIGFFILRPLRNAPRTKLKTFEGETTVDQPLVDTTAGASKI